MSRVRVTHSLDDLASDLLKIATTTKPKMAKVVKRGIKVGETVAKDLAKGASGPHGKSYYKRIGSEMTGLLEGEWGPSGEVRDNAVGAGWRHGENTDLDKSADLMSPSFAQEVGDVLDDQFWPT